MNWDKMNKLKVIIFSIFLFLLFPAAGWAPVLPPEEYFFEQGKEALEHQDLSGAYYSFQDALSINPDHQGANLFYALTRVLMISKSTNFNKLLDRSGMSTYGRDIFNWTADFKRDPQGNILLSSGSPTGAELQAFLKNAVLPQISGALNNLSVVDSSYGTTFKWIVENGLGVVNSPNILIDITKSWMPNEWKDYKLLIDGIEYTITGNTQNMIYVSSNWTISAGTHIYDIFGNVEIDYGDVLVMKGFLYLAKAAILTLSSYDLNIDIDAIVSLFNSGIPNLQTQINNSKNFLNLLTTQQLSEAKTALREGLNILTQAINFITTELDSQEDDLIIINPEDKQPYLDLLADLNSALNKTTLIRKIGLEVDLREFFDYPKNLRGYLPTFLGPYKDGWLFIKRGSFPDPTFGGILPNMTREELEKRLEDNIRESHPISPLVLYDDFLAPKIDKNNRWWGGELVRERIQTGDYVYDDFSAPHIDNKRWRQGDLVREIQGGKAVFKQASPNPIPPPLGISTPYAESNWLRFPDSNAVNSIQADVTVLESSVTNSATARARLAGTWYSAVSPGGPGSTGDIFAAIDIRQTSEGLFARWGIDQCTNSDCTTSDPSMGDYFSTPISLGKTYTLYIEYDDNNHRFIFRIGNGVGKEERIFPDPDKPGESLPENKGDAVNPLKGIGTRVVIDDATSSGYVSATFDNVYENGSLYDNFSLPTINPVKWTTYELAREIKGGKFRSKVRSSESYTPTFDGAIYFEIPTTISAFQAKVTPLIYLNPQGLFQRAAIDGIFFNDGTSGAGTIGDIFAQVRIGGTEIKPVAEWAVSRFKDAAGTSPEVIASGKFNTAISLGQTYLLSLGWDGIKFTFKINNEVANYTPTTNIYPAKVPFRRLSTRIEPEVNKKDGTIEALFDDVTIVGSDYKLLFKTASPNPNVAPYTTYNELPFSNPISLNSIKADVAVLENTIASSAQTRARLAGIWYNDGTVGGGMTGDIWAEISLRGTPGGLYATWGVYRFKNADGTDTDSFEGNFRTPITVGVTYPLYIGYNSGSNQFTFRVWGEEITFSMPGGIWAGNAKNPLKSLSTRVQIDNPASSGYISATFDNVYVNGGTSAYDDFSSPSTINEAKWKAYEIVRENKGGKFRSKVRSSSGTTSSVVSRPETQRPEFLYPSEISAIQTKVMPLAYQNGQGASVGARIVGHFYNDGTTPGGGFIGDVIASVRIGGTQSNPIAEWNVRKYTDSGGTSAQEIASGTFTTPISVDGKTYYTLFLGWDGWQFTFKIGNEVAYYIPETGVYPPNKPWRSIETQIANPAGKEATMEALFDDVMVSGPLLSVSPASYDFGQVIAPTISAAKTFTLTNNGTTSIGINSIDLVGGDASMFDIVSTTCPGPSSTLSPKGKCNIVISFQPTSEGLKATALRFILNSPPAGGGGNPAISMPLKGTGTLETISTPATPVGLTVGTTGTTYNYTTGGSSSNLTPPTQHPIQYLFDWDDGTNSGWLPVGKTTASKIWTTSGTYNVKAMARCATHKPVVSNLSPSKTANITIPIRPTLPPIGSVYNVSSLYYPNCYSTPIPTFGWNASEYFKGYKIQFSTDYKFKLISLEVASLTATATIPKSTWQTILSKAGKSGGVLYWRVVGTRSNTTIATSETSFIIVGPPEPVLDAKFSHTSKTAIPPPTLTWKNNYNTKYKVYVANDPDFSKPGIKKYTSPLLSDDPCADGGMFDGPLTPGYWASVYGVVNGEVGKTIYWYVESTDILGRSAKTDVMSFVLQP